MKTQAQARLSTRQRTAGHDHHLWDNHGTWWFHGTFHLPDGTAERVRTNRRTKCVREARRLRDRLVTRMASRPQSA